MKDNKDGTQTFSNSFSISPNHKLHPGLPDKKGHFKDRLDKANTLGFKVLKMVNWGTVRSSEVPEEMFVSFKNTDQYWSYANKLGECTNYIAELKSGHYEYKQLQKAYKFNDELNPINIKDINSNEKIKFSKAIAEWVDGDSLSAHYASGNDIFCTDDCAKEAGESSIFSKNNKSKVKKRFNLNILSSEELLQLFKIIN